MNRSGVSYSLSNGFKYSKAGKSWFECPLGVFLSLGIILFIGSRGFF